MNAPKKHHYVPQFILRNFADEDGKVWWTRKGPPQIGPHSKNPLEVFAENNLYAFNKDDGKNTEVETDLGRFESEVAPIVEKLIKWDRVLPCPVSGNDFLELNRFVVQIFKRNPVTLNEHVTYESIKKSFEDDLASYKQAGKVIDPTFKTMILEPEYIKACVKEVQVSSVMLISQEMENTLSKRGVFLAYSSEHHFVIGDNPILRRTGLDHGGLIDPTAEFWLPIAPNLAVTPFGAQGKLTLLKANSFCVKSFNEQSWLQSNAIVAKQEASLLELLPPTIDELT